MKIKKKGKQLFAVLLSIAMIITTMPFGVVTASAVTIEFAGGSGTESDPYLIETKEHLNNVRNDLNAHYKMIANIVFDDSDFEEGGIFFNNGFGWNPIATGGTSFRGNFDGNNYFIQGLTVNINESPNEESSYGLFGNISSATVKNLKMKETTILVNNNHYIYAGCISGSAYKSIIDNCSAEGVITAKNSNESCALYAGGIVGQAVSSTVTNVESTVNINSVGNDRIGGICGHISSGSVLNATNRGVLQGTTATGGIAGEASNSSIENGVNYGALSSISSQESINNSCDCGGTVAWAVGKTTITRCSNQAKVSSYSMIQYGSTAAGIVATITADKNDNALVSNCYNNGEISARGATGSNAGGISGTYYFSTIRDCYNSGNINSVSNAGGIVSFSQGATIETCYNVGDITATYVGGIVGENITSTFNNCIYKDSVSNACGKSALALKKCTSEEMQQKAIYTDWDFENTWDFLEGNAYVYPTFKTNEYYLINDNLDFQSGKGTEQEPYLIASTKHFNNIRKHLNSHFKLVRNIVFSPDDFAQNGMFYNSGQGWTPIGDSEDNAFTGVLDGNNYTVENVINNLVYINGNVSGSNKIYSTYIGLFGYNKGTLRNLTVSNAKIDVQLNSIRNNAVWGYVGIICAENEGTIIDCSVSGKVRTTENYITEQTIYTDVDSNVGGITGRNTGIIRGCDSKALLIGHSAGGIVGGENSQGAVIDSCYNLGIVSASDYASGICGGVNYGEITKCYNSGIVDGNRYVSGIASNNGHFIENSFNCGELVGGSFVGGIVADWNTGNINYCYNVGNINSTDYFGGIIFPSQNSESGTVSNSYYLDNIPEEVGTGRKEGTRYSYEQMQNKDSYQNFDFSAIWEFDEDADYIFPTLRNIEYAKVDISIFETADGIGTWWDPYKIRTKHDLNAIRNDLSACYKLVNNISFEQSDFAEGGSFYNNGQGWKPIGSKVNAFTGVFDGNGFNIENLYINLSLNSDAYIGLFGYSKGEINNLGIIATNYVIDASNKNAYIGGIVGYSESNISNCSVEGKINIESTSSIANEVIAGGIVGTLGADELLTINSCFNDCDITVIRNITSTATSGGVATTSAGGVIGKTTSDTTIFNCNNAGNIYTTYNGGQLVDIVSAGILGKSWFNTSVLDSCYNYGNITAYSLDAENTINNHAGGIAGDAYSLKITKCYNTGNISSNHNSGGIFANTTSSVESETADCFNVGNISSGFSSGGIGGSTEATITNCYNVGFVEGKIYGGIVGFNNGGNATVTNCFYWDIVDKGVGNWDDSAVKCSLSELKKSDTYQGFDFENNWSQSSSSNYAFPVLQGASFVFEKEIVAIKIKTLPTKLKYLEAKDTLNVSGGEIELFYNNGDVDSVSLTNNMITGFNNSNVGTQTLTVTYEGKTCNYDVEVIAKSLVSIAVTTKPSKLSYLEGKDKLNVSGGIVTLYYDNDTRDTVNLNSDMVAGFNNAIVGEQNLTVTYKGKTTSFLITIMPKTTTSISVINKPNKVTYLEGENFETAGLVVKAYYNNDTSSVVNDYTISGYSSSVGTKTITVSYGGKTTTFTVTVNSRVPSTVTSSKHTITGNNISKITAGTTVSSLLSGLNEGSYCKVYKGNSVVSGNTAVGTGMVVKIMDGNTVKASYTVIVTGDTNGDGTISVTDMIAIKAHILNKSTLTGVYATAANTNGDSGISITDFIQVKAKILGKGSITAR